MSGKRHTWRYSKPDFGTNLLKKKRKKKGEADSYHECTAYGPCDSRENRKWVDKALQSCDGCNAKCSCAPEFARIYTVTVIRFNILNLLQYYYDVVYLRAFCSQ